MIVPMLPQCIPAVNDAIGSRHIRAALHREIDDEVVQLVCAHPALWFSFLPDGFDLFKARLRRKRCVHVARADDIDSDVELRPLSL